jgi:hypothetical protein
VPRPVIARSDATGTTDGAALLAIGPDAELLERADPPPIAPLEIDLRAWADEWHRRAGS